MQRRSYYPQNQQIVSTVTATSSTGVVSSRPVTPATISGDADIVHSDNYGHKPSHETIEMDSRAIPMDEIDNEKAYAC